MKKTPAWSKALSLNKAFTLIELLVVIAVIGVLVAVILPNLIGMRERARDTVKKNDLAQLKTALRLYYNDYQLYPDDDSNGQLCCNAPGASCEVCVDDFSVDGVDYMAELPSFDYDYSQEAAGDNFLLSSRLENLADESAAQSAARCDIAAPTLGVFYQCAD